MAGRFFCANSGGMDMDTGEVLSATMLKFDKKLIEENGPPGE